jgi:hypothetical protein
MSNEADQHVTAEVKSMHMICYSNKQCCMTHTVVENGDLLLSRTLYQLISNRVLETLSQKKTNILLPEFVRVEDKLLLFFYYFISQVFKVVSRGMVE